MDSYDCAYDSLVDDFCDCNNDSQRYEKEFERLLQLIFPRLPFPFIHDAYAISFEDSKELTVYYPQNFCKFIGCTHIFPGPNDKYAVEQHRQAFQACTTWKACQEYMSEQHNQLLIEDMSVDPEGFVLYYWCSEGI
ncbi:hypothetical protein CEXT_662651 [Caerostris extrusa]|uniref:Uncharacterized protein n=1 Tax=Caerostris extrusa TaxID=172846 RepID=A0AAV4QWC2_CAEEX|nr:hypothetical protein CEXT_662651 [Caerostris extrusa]